MDKLTSWEFGLTPDQMREVDRLAEAEYGIAPIQLMEVAGLQTARVARGFLKSNLRGQAVCILTGKGNNGGDGMVTARRLAAWGAAPLVLTSFPEAKAGGLTATQLRSARASGAHIEEWTGSLPAADLYIDALLGFGASGAPRGTTAQMITSLSDARSPVLSVDLPSGMDAADGSTPGDCVVADTTVTLGCLKTGMLRREAMPYVGTLLVADIGIPIDLMRRLGIDSVDLFAGGEIVSLDYP
ncbi:MAG: NAD(P)H-hydrate epimerase [Candidatus Dormibacteria bacterium]